MVLKQKRMSLVLEGAGKSYVTVRTVVAILAVNDIQHGIWHKCKAIVLISRNSTLESNSLQNE